MAVLGRILLSSAERLDLADLLSVDSYTAGDFKYLIKSFVGDSTPYVLKGFDVLNPSSCIGTTSCSFRVADSVVYYPSSSTGSFFYGLPEGNALSEPLIPELRSGATNYIYLTFTTTDQAADSRAFWDPDKNAGEGGEFSQEVNTESVLTVMLNTSVATFPEGTIPVAMIVTNDAGTITSMRDCRDMMFRLGTGGASPNPYYNHEFRPLPLEPYSRLEPPTMMSGLLDPNPFQGGDKNIYTLKEWMDVVMTKIKELSGTAFWYQPSSAISVASLFQDTVGSTLKSKGTWIHDQSTAGLVTWTADIIYKSLQDPRDLIIRASSVTLADEQVAFVNLVRGADINAGPDPVQFYAGKNWIDGNVGAFQNLAIGDWIRKKVDSEEKSLRVEGFYAGQGGIFGLSASAALARSIKLNGNYAGTDGLADAVYTRGIYTSSDVQITDRNSPVLQAAGGNLFWLVARSDTILNVTYPGSYSMAGTVTAFDSTTATITTATAHGLVDGDRVKLETSIAGEYIVDKVDDYTFTVQATSGTLGAVNIQWAVVTTTARWNDNNTFILEDANHGFESGETVIFTNGSNVKTSKIINVRGATTLQIAGSLSSPVTVSGVRVHVKKAFGSMRIVQGESVDIGEVDGENIQKYIGMTSLAQTYPVYTLPASYNTIIGEENFNSNANDDLTLRAAKLTAMMADRVQDRGIQFRGAVTLRNTTSGANQVITANTTITVDKPKSPSQVVTLNCSLAANTAAVVTIDRSGSGALTVATESLGSSFLLAENKFILMYRLATTSVYAWDGHKIPANGTYSIGAIEHNQNKNIRSFYPSEVRIDTDPSSPTVDHFFFENTSAPMTILISGSSFNNTINTAAIMAAGVTLLDGQSMWVRINRLTTKTFTTVSYVDAPDTDIAGTVYVTGNGSVPNEQDVFVIYQRFGDTLLGTRNLDQMKGNVYDEIIDVVTSPTIGNPREIVPIPAGSTVSIPPDSNDYDTTQIYVVGSGQLEVDLNGQRQHLGRDYEEVGAHASYSGQIRMLRALVVGDTLGLRIDTTGSVYFYGSSGATPTMQATYNSGRFITVSSGQPVVLQGSGLAETLMHITENMQVDGVVNANQVSTNAVGLTPQVLNPLPLTQTGLWANSGGHIMIQSGDGSAPIDVTGILEALTAPKLSYSLMYQLTATDLTNKYFELPHEPVVNMGMSVCPVGGAPQFHNIPGQDFDFEMVVDAGGILKRRLFWYNLGMDQVGLEEGDYIYVTYFA